MFFAPLLLALACGQTPEPTLNVPAETRGAAGRPIFVSADTAGKVVVWHPKDSGLDIIDPKYLRDGKMFGASAPAGRYRVLVITAIADIPHIEETVLIFEGQEPNPPPPGPKPPPPTPDNLAQRLKSAYDADVSPAKKGQLVNLIGIYSAMADHVEKDAGIATTKDLANVLAKVKTGMLTPNVLMDLRRILDAELAATFGSPNTTPLDRPKAAALFRRIVAALPRPD